MLVEFFATFKRTEEDERNDLKSAKRLYFQQVALICVYVTSGPLGSAIEATLASVASGCV